MKHTTIPIRNTISAAGIDDKTLSLLWTQRWCWHWNYEAVESEPGPSRPIYSFGKILIKLYVFDGDSPTLSSHKSLPPASQPPPSSSSSAPPASCPPYTNWRRVEDKHFWQMEVLCSIYEGSQGHFGYKKKGFGGKFATNCFYVRLLLIWKENVAFALWSKVDGVSTNVVEGVSSKIGQSWGGARTNYPWVFYNN